MFLSGVFIGATGTGALATSLIFWSAITGKELFVSAEVVDALSYIPLALGMTAGLILWFNYTGTSLTLELIASVGRMALTNCLAQSVIFSLIFYGYGLQQFGKLAPAPTAVIGIALFSVQVTISHIAFSITNLARWKGSGAPLHIRDGTLFSGITEISPRPHRTSPQGTCRPEIPAIEMERESASTTQIR